MSEKLAVSNSQNYVKTIDSHLVEDTLFFTNLLLKNKMCDRPTLHQLLQNKSNDIDPINWLINNLLSQGVVNLESIQPIIQELTLFRSRFGRIGIELKKVTPKQVQFALDQKKKLKEEKNIDIFIGEILTKYKIITANDINEILDLQQKRIKQFNSFLPETLQINSVNVNNQSLNNRDNEPNKENTNQDQNDLNDQKEDNNKIVNLALEISKDEMEAIIT